MEIQSSKLQRIFKYLAPSIGSSLKYAEYNSFLFDATSDNLMVRAYNGTTESIVNMGGQFEPMRFAVDEFIYQIVNQLEGEINFELDGTNLIVDCGAKHYEFATIDCELWQPIMSPLNCESFDLEWIRVFNKTQHCVAIEESRPIYCGYHVRDGCLFATDSYRVITTPITLDDCSLPQKEFDLILRCLSGTVEYNFDDNIYFECKSDEFTIRYMTSKFESGEPFNAKQWIKEKESNEIIATITIDNLANLLKDIVLMQKQAKKIGDNKFVLAISFESNNLYFDTKIQGLSNSHQQIDCELDTEEEFKRYFYPNQLMDFAKVAKGTITIKILKDVDAPILLYDDESKSIIMRVCAGE